MDNERALKGLDHYLTTPPEDYLNDPDSYYDEYEHFVMHTARPIGSFQGRCLKGALGLASEAGEIAGIFEKWIFQDHPIDREEVKKELGDALWYLTYLILGHGWTLEEIMEHNTAKLSKRYPKGKFDGEDSIRRADGG